MIPDKIISFLATAAPPATRPNPQAEMMKTFGMMAVMVFIFYFLFIRPQQKKAKEHALLLKTLRPGDKVVTNGGVVGVIITVKEKTVTLRTADTKMELLKSAVTEISERGESES
jgi:preprotein translocase subunit YajC